MAALPQRFNAQDHDTTQNDYSNLPAGIYKVEVEAADVGPSSSGKGTVLKVTVRVIEPAQYEGRKIFGNYNLEHEKAQAQEIGQKQFAALCRAIGLTEVDDTEDLMFRAFTVSIGLGKDSKEKNDDGTPKYAAKSEIKRYWFPDEGNVPEPAVTEAPKPANDNRPAPAAARPAQAVQGGTANGRKNPWGSK